MSDRRPTRRLRSKTCHMSSSPPSRFSPATAHIQPQAPTTAASAKHSTSRLSRSIRSSCRPMPRRFRMTTSTTTPTTSTQSSPAPDGLSSTEPRNPSRQGNTSRSTCTTAGIYAPDPTDSPSSPCAQKQSQSSPVVATEPAAPGDHVPEMAVRHRRSMTLGRGSDQVGDDLRRHDHQRQTATGMRRSADEVETRYR